MVCFKKSHRFIEEYSDCLPELLELANALKATVKDGKISKTDKSTGLSKYWKVVKAIEKADKT
tara:strand:- start:742 stop:930 length:189 start_codon:yes stop_codon:yes gene_type:complete